MPRKRILYNSVDECLQVMLDNPDYYKTMLAHRHRLLNHYNDLEQYNIVDKAIKLYQSFKNIENLDLN